jgi:uncharacterized protein YjbI with pentapeptide repeats
MVGASMMWCSLVDASLRGADLTGADLPWADLTEANLDEALLTAVNLQEALLKEANLSGAWLPAAHLHRSDLTRATLSGAHLTAESWGGRQLLSAWEAASRINRRPSLPLTPAMWASVLLRDDQRLDAHFAASMRADSGFAKEETTAQRRRLLMTARARLYQARVPRPAPRKVSRAQQRRWDIHYAETYGRTILTKAVLIGTDLARADVTGADLTQCNLADVKGLTTEQIRLAKTDSTTTLPPSLRGRQPR